MKLSKKQEYNIKYDRKNYERISLYFYKGKRDLLKQCAKDNGISVAQLIIIALESTYGLDLSKD